MGRGKQACVAGIAICLLGVPAEARHRSPRVTSTTLTTTTLTTTTVTSGSTTTSTLPPGTPPGFSMLESAFGTLVDEVNAEPMSAHLRSQLLKQIGHAQGNVAKAVSLLAAQKRPAAKSALKHALRWMISFHYRVGSNSGRRGSMLPSFFSIIVV